MRGVWSADSEVPLQFGRRFRESRGFYMAYRRMRMVWVRARYRLRNVHPTFYVAGSCKISPDLQAGAYSFVNAGCRIPPGVELGPYVMLGPRVAIVGQDHRFDIAGVPTIFSGRPQQSTTVIEADVWVGYGAILIAGIRVGRGSIIAAGSVVTKDVAPYKVLAGVPAREIRERFAGVSERERHDAMLAGPIQHGPFAGRKIDLRQLDES